MNSPAPCPEHATASATHHVRKCRFRTHQGNEQHLQSTTQLSDIVAMCHLTGEAARLHNVSDCASHEDLRSE
jgi:hypothetical protein